MPPFDILAWADHLGRHAVAWCAATVALALVVVLGSWRLHHAARPWRHAVHERWPAGRAFTLALALLAALVTIVAAAHAVAELAEAIGPSGEVSRADERVIAAVGAHVDPLALHLFAWISHAGDKRTLVLLGAVVGVALLWRGHMLLAFGWAAGLALNGVLIRLLKATVERVRPVHEHELAVVDGWSFPSGHTSGALVAYGLLAWLALHLLPRRWHVPALVGAVVAAVTIGWSRVILQVHFPSDVIAGWAAGGAWLTGCVVALELATRHVRGRAGARTGRREAGASPP